MDIWVFQKALTQRLTLWALISILLGALCFLPQGDFWGGLAFQFLGWALIDLGIASFGYFSLRRRLAKLTAAERKLILPEETEKMIFLLQGSTVLSMVCILLGFALIFFMQAHGGFWVGVGLAIILQSFFMFFFNRYHMRKLQ